MGDRELQSCVPPRLEVEQRDFLKVHRKGGERVPALRDAPIAGLRRRLRHDLLPRLPALSDALREPSQLT